MDPQPQQSAPIVNNVPMQPPAGNSSNGQKKVGPIIAILVIVLILIIAALYIFASYSNPTTIPETSTVGQGSQSVQPVTNSSDDVTSLEADLNTATKGLDNQNF